MTIKIIKRNEWKARAPKKESLPIVLPVPKIIITHTMTRPCKSEFKCKALVRQIQRKHMKKHLDIVYNFLIGGDGQIYEGAGFLTNNLFSKPEKSDEENSTETTESSDTKTDEETAEGDETIRKAEEEKDSLLMDAITKYRMTFPKFPRFTQLSSEPIAPRGMDQSLLDRYLLKVKEEKRMAEQEEKFNEVEESMESFKESAPRTIGELLEFAASYTEEVTGQKMRPKPWDGSDPQYNGDSISIALIGDHTELIKYHQEKMKHSGDTKESHSDQNAISSKLESLAMDLINHGIETEHIDENWKIDWFKQNQWKEYLQTSLLWVPPDPKEKKAKK